MEEIKKDEIKKVKLVARYDADTRRTHRFLIEPGKGIAGSIYVSKVSRPIPRQIEIDVKMKGDQ